MRSLFTLFAVASLFVIGCTNSPSVKQRDYILAEVLTDTAPPTAEQESEKAEYKLTRSGEVGYTKVSISPILPSHLREAEENLGLKHSLSRKAIEANYKQSVAKFVTQKTCLNVYTTGYAEDSANLNFYSIFHEENGTMHKLKPVGTIELPAGETVVSSYSSPGYSYQSGGNFYYSPGYSSSRSYRQYKGSATFCTPKRLDLSKGLTLYVQARYRRGIAPEDFVWSTDPKDKKTFAYLEGRPAPFYRAEWNKLRTEAIQTKFSKLVP